MAIATKRQNSRVRFPRCRALKIILKCLEKDPEQRVSQWPIKDLQRI